MGLLLAVVVHWASIQDRTGARAVLVRLSASFEPIQTVFADGGYSGELIDWTRLMFGWL
jgi:putative transposase